LSNINDLNYEIIGLVYELDETQEVLKTFIYDNELSEENQVYLSEIGDRHLKLCDKLKVLLECYFKEERDNGIPTSFAYKRLYKQLSKV